MDRCTGSPRAARERTLICSEHRVETECATVYWLPYINVDDSEYLEVAPDQSLLGRTHIKRFASESHDSDVMILGNLG